MLPNPTLLALHNQCEKLESATKFRSFIQKVLSAGCPWKAKGRSLGKTKLYHSYEAKYLVSHSERRAGAAGKYYCVLDSVVERVESPNQ